MPHHHFTGVLKREKELARQDRAAAKRVKRRQHRPEGDVVPPGEEKRFESAFPDAPAEGIARTMCRDGDHGR